MKHRRTLIFYQKKMDLNQKQLFLIAIFVSIEFSSIEATPIRQGV